ncbi:unnamed protein product [Effrenium voratum]|uniref:Uncharacterized protein n=1 Tax=Effrenium voratum TaxID=2562239 RepID=A0AA36HZ42_9DINO|nr:unnamed protein product [Effrenium voratum]CAJ1425010.1 unnamed protein product [Effrenium voratum]
MDAAGAAAAAALLWSGQGSQGSWPAQEAGRQSDSETQESEEDGSDHPATGTLVKLRNFPASWVEEDVLPFLPEKLARLLRRFGPLLFEPAPEADLQASGPIFFAAFREAAAAEEAVAKLHGVDLRSNAEKRAAGGRPAQAWERFSVQTEEPTALSSAVLAHWAQRGVVKPDDNPDNLQAEDFEFEFADSGEFAEGDGSETEPPTEPPSEGEVSEDRSKVTVLLRNFPSSWLSEEALPQLSARITALLNKFGQLRSKPKVLESSIGLVATATFQELQDAEKAIQALDGLDWRSPAEAKDGRPASAHEYFRAEMVQEVASRLQELAAAPSMAVLGAGGFETMVEGAAAAQAFLSAEVDPSFQGYKAKRERVKVKLQQTGRNLRWEKANSDAEEDPAPAQWPTTAWTAFAPETEAVEVAPEMRELDPADTHLVIRGVPWDWSALQLQMLFTPFGGVQAMQAFASDEKGGRIVRVRLEDLAQHAVAAVHFQQPQGGLMLRCEHVLGPREKELLALAAERERRRREEEAEEARQRQVAIEEAERQKQAAAFAERRGVWEVANADFAAAVLAKAEKDLDRSKRLQAAADSLRDPSLSKQRRRMLVALVEAERKRQAPMIPGLEQAAMAAADAEIKAWQHYVIQAERDYLNLIQEAEAAETRAMSKADRDSRRAEQARVDLERKRRRRERELRAIERAAMLRADEQSRAVEEATALAEEQTREEFEAELMERAEDEVREFCDFERRREAEERRRMAADEAEFHRLQEEERRRKVEEERKQKLVMEWRRKQAARRALDSDEEPSEADEDDKKSPDRDRSNLDRKKDANHEEQSDMLKAARNPFGPVRERPAEKETSTKPEKESKRTREEEKRRLKEEEAAKRRKREKEEAAAELQRFEQELQRRNNFLLRRRQQEEDDLRKEAEAQEQAVRDEEERKKREVEQSRMAWEDKLRMKFEVEERRKEAEARKHEEAERRKQERAERKREAMRPQETVRLLQEKEQEIKRMQAELAKKREEAKKQEEQRERGSSSAPASRSSSPVRKEKHKRRKEKRRSAGSRSRSERRNKKRKKRRNQSSSSSSRPRGKKRKVSYVR